MATHRCVSSQSDSIFGWWTHLNYCQESSISPLCIYMYVNMCKVMLIANFLIHSFWDTLYMSPWCTNRKILTKTKIVDIKWLVLEGWFTQKIILYQIVYLEFKLEKNWKLIYCRKILIFKSYTNQLKRWLNCQCYIKDHK